MNNSIIRKQIKSVISENKLNTLGKELGFTKRQRDVCGFNMVNSLIASAGDGGIQSLADMSREFNSLTGHALAPKPFHNQLKKPELEKLLRKTAETAITKWVRRCYQFNPMYKKYFSRVLLHDGTTLSLHDGLKEIFPGRFTKTSPAAVELHVSMDLMTNSVAGIDIAADKETERQFLPTADKLTNTLLMADAGYFDKTYFEKLCQACAYFIIRAGININPMIVSGIRHDGNSIKVKKKTKLKDIKEQLPKDQSFELSVQWDKSVYRLIGFWVADKKKFSYIVTNLPKTNFSMIEVGKLYRLRWQIELLFKEWKSNNNLKKFNTQNATIIYTLIWASLLAMTLKRLLAGYVEEYYNIFLSSLTVSKTTQGWWYALFEAILAQSQRKILTVLDKCSMILSHNAKLSNPNRDIKTGKFQFFLQSATCKGL